MKVDLEKRKKLLSSILGESMSDDEINGIITDLADKDKKDTTDAASKEDADKKKEDDKEDDSKEDADKEDSDEKKEDEDEKKDVSEESDLTTDVVEDMDAILESYRDKKEALKEHFDYKVATVIKDETNALFESANISKENQEKLGVLIESTVNSLAKQHIDKIDKINEAIIVDVMNEKYDELVEAMNSYMNVVITEWKEENKIAIESGLKTKLAESFMLQLRDLFENHYIDIPESKVDVVKKLVEKVEVLDEKLNAQIKKNVALSESITKTKKESIIAESLAGLVATDAVKLKNLIESVVFTTEEDFTKKVGILKESINKKTEDKKETVKQPLNESNKSDDTVDPRMAAYMGYKIGV